MALCSFKLYPVEDDNGNIVMRHYDDIGSRGPQVAVTYEIALDPNFEQIIDSIYFDTNPDHFMQWHSPLPVIGKEGEYYDNLEKVYARGRIYCGIIPTNFKVPENITDEELCRMIDATDGAIHYSQWTETGVDTQLYQKVIYTSGKEVLEETDTNEINFNFR